MRSILIVIRPPVFDPAASICHRQEPRRVQAFLPKPTVERFDEGIVSRFSRPREFQCHAVQVRPLVQHAARKLRAIVHPKALRLAPKADNPRGCGGANS